MPSASNQWRLNGRPIVIANYGAPPSDLTHHETEDSASATMPSLHLGEDSLRTSVRVLTPAEVLNPSLSGIQNNTAKSPNIRLQGHFPPAGSTFEGGQSDGYCFRLDFRSSRAQRNLEMITAFLGEFGYGDVPLPADIKELRAFRLPRKQRKQLQFFTDDGYIHNPIKILFPPPGTKGQGLRLEVYNEFSERHLLRFHGRA